MRTDAHLFLIRASKWWVEPAFIGPRGGVHAAHIVAEYPGWRNGLPIAAVDAGPESGGVEGANRIAESIVVLHNVTAISEGPPSTGTPRSANEAHRMSRLMEHDLRERHRNDPCGCIGGCTRA